MDGEISFDTIFPEAPGEHHVEGCYRLPGQDWEVFYFTHRHKGAWWTSLPIIRKDVTWPSGIGGVEAVCPLSDILNKSTVKSMLADILGVKNWKEVHGPDSLQLK